MSSIIESEFKSRLFDVNCQLKTSVDDLPLFSFYSSLLINFYVKDKLILFHYIPKKVKKKKTKPQTMMVKVLIDEYKL